MLLFINALLEITLKSLVQKIVVLSKNDPRYIKWKESLKKRPFPWNKGFTKETRSSVAKIFRIFKKEKIDNFARWRKKMINRGLIKTNCLSLQRSGDLAELRSRRKSVSINKLILINFYLLIEINHYLRMFTES